MRTQGVIKAFDVGKDGVLCSGAGIKAKQMDKLTLQTAEKILRHGVVVGVALEGHDLTDTELPEALPIGGDSILDATVRVKNEPIAGLFPADSHVPYVQRELGVDATGEGVANDLFRAQILDGGQIQPALACGMSIKSGKGADYKRVKANKGALRVDGMTIEEALPRLREY